MLVESAVHVGLQQLALANVQHFHVRKPLQPGEMFVAFARVKDEPKFSAFHVHKNGGVPFVCVPESKGSEQQTVPSGVFLALARPQCPPENTTAAGTGIGVLAVPGVWLAFLPPFWGGCLPFRPFPLLCHQCFPPQSFCFPQALQKVTIPLAIACKREGSDAGHDKPKLCKSGPCSSRGTQQERHRLLLVDCKNTCGHAEVIGVSGRHAHACQRMLRGL